MYFCSTSNSMTKVYLSSKCAVKSKLYIYLSECLYYIIYILYFNDQNQCLLLSDCEWMTEWEKKYII